MNPVTLLLLTSASRGHMYGCLLILYNKTMLSPSVHAGTTAWPYTPGGTYIVSLNVWISSCRYQMMWIIKPLLSYRPGIIKVASIRKWYMYSSISRTEFHRGGTGFPCRGWPSYGWAQLSSLVFHDVAGFADTDPAGGLDFMGILFSACHDTIMEPADEVMHVLSFSSGIFHSACRITSGLSWTPGLFSSLLFSSSVYRQYSESSVYILWILGKPVAGLHKIWPDGQANRKNIWQLLTIKRRTDSGDSDKSIQQT